MLLVTTAAATGPAHAAPGAAGADAELIRTCHQFTETELGRWYRYVVAPAHLADDLDDQAPDWDTLHWIIATPATTHEGWHAKALALSAWDREAYWNDDDRGTHTELLSSLLRDMVAPARDAIVARLAAQYGPLPDTYTPEGMWLGYDARRTA